MPVDLNRSLLWTVGLGWLGFLIVGVAVARLFAISQVTVLIDRSACNPEGWQQVSDRYNTLYQAHQRKRIRLVQVVIVSDLGAEVRETLPSPAEFNRMKTSGKANPERFEQLKSSFDNVNVIACDTESTK